MEMSFHVSVVPEEKEVSGIDQTSASVRIHGEKQVVKELKKVIEEYCKEEELFLS